MIGAKVDECDVRDLSEKDFRYICKLVYESAGIVLDERKREMIHRRLIRRTRHLKIDSMSAYCDYLRSNTNDELLEFINSFTTNLTSFFREKHHFDYLQTEYVPKLLRDYRSSLGPKRLRIWSSACSTGEEPYSVAISLKRVMGPQMTEWDTKILATDLDSNVLETASRGVYNFDRIVDLDVETQSRWFKKGSGENSGMVKVHPELRQHITFKQLNLLRAWPMKGPFDVIFCRNVLIYFDKQTQQTLIPRYYDLLKPGGLLFLGHSENMPNAAGNFKFLGKTMFEKVA